MTATNDTRTAQLLIGSPYLHSRHPRGLAHRRLPASTARGRADGDAAAHGGVYRTVVRDRPPPFKHDRVRIPRHQHPGIELPVVRRHRVRALALVDPPHR